MPAVDERAVNIVTFIDAFDDVLILEHRRARRVAQFA